jgi:hypothetical protein
MTGVQMKGLTPEEQKDSTQLVKMYEKIISQVIDNAAAVLRSTNESRPIEEDVDQRITESVDSQINGINLQNKVSESTETIIRKKLIFALKNNDGYTDSVVNAYDIRAYDIPNRLIVDPLYKEKHGEGGKIGGYKRWLKSYITPYN